MNEYLTLSLPYMVAVSIRLTIHSQ